MIPQRLHLPPPLFPLLANLELPVGEEGDEDKGPYSEYKTEISNSFINKLTAIQTKIEEIVVFVKNSNDQFIADFEKLSLKLTERYQKLAEELSFYIINKIEENQSLSKKLKIQNGKLVENKKILS